MKTAIYQNQRYRVAFTTDDSVVLSLPESEIYGHISRMPVPTPQTDMRSYRDDLQDAIICALRKQVALSTRALSEYVGRDISFPECDWSAAWFKQDVYRACQRMEPNLLVSAKKWNGKAYERIWRRK